MMDSRTGVVLSIIFFLISTGAAAQDEWNIPWTIVGDTAEIPLEKEVVTGTVLHKDTQQPIPGALVSVDYFKHFDYTDDQGRYYLELTPGPFRFIIKHVGFRPVYLRVKVVTGGVLDITMEEGTVVLETVVISSRPIDSNIKESLSGLTKFNIQEIKTLPTLLGEVDIIKSLQLMPGVTSVGEGSSGFNVRGGRADQNLVLLNDVPLFNSSHALGFISSFSQDFINSFSLYKGNVPANLGGRAASALEITTRRADLEKWRFQGGAGILTSRFTAEGPLKKNETSILLSGRIAYPDWVTKKVDNPDVKGSHAAFHDIFVTLNHRFTENSLADITFYSSSDFFQFSDQFAFSWKNDLFNLKWQALTNRKLSPALSLSYSYFRNTLFDPSGPDASQLSNRLDYLQLKPTVQYVPNDQHEVVAGIEVLTYLPALELKQGYKGNTAVLKQQIGKNNGLESSIFVNDVFDLNDKVSLTAGLRYSMYTHLGKDTVYYYLPGSPKSVFSIQDTAYYSAFESIKRFGGFEPRVSARFSISQNQSIKFSYNRMRQYIHQVSNTAASTPVDLWQVSTEYLPPQIVDNYSLGYFLNIKNNRWEISFELFYKNSKNLVEYKDFPTLFLNRHIETELLSGEGRAYGAEAYIRLLKGKSTGWLSYTYSQTQIKINSPYASETINDGEWFPSNYNKPHNLNLVLNRSFSAGGAFSFIFSYNSGRPFTAVESSYIAGPTVVPIYSKRNEYSIPDYIRADISFTIGNIINNLDDSLVFSVYNLLGRDNAYSVFYKRPTNHFFIPKAYKLSVLGAALPSLTYNFKF